MVEMNPLDSQSSEEFRQPLLGIWLGASSQFALSANSSIEIALLPHGRNRKLTPSECTEQAASGPAHAVKHPHPARGRHGECAAPYPE